MEKATRQSKFLQADDQFESGKNGGLRFGNKNGLPL